MSIFLFVFFLKKKKELKINTLVTLIIFCIIRKSVITPCDENCSCSNELLLVFCCSLRKRNDVKILINENLKQHNEIRSIQKHH
jgi:hypothetical protein